MGVPALFRWLSKKYPKIIESIAEDALPLDGAIPPFHSPTPHIVEIDNLYLDMNGIIHPCCHPTDKPAPKTEALMMRAIFEYLDRIMALVRPRRLVYMAIDGVAPRAKMNQQRSRRFRAAKEQKEKSLDPKSNEGDAQDACAADAEEAGEFDSNVITPGTAFMALITKAIKYYIQHRMNTVEGWRKLKVVLSDWTVPGEGEHKIIDFIRRQRLDPEYDANQEHVIYGLDADLIMLTLATHEPRFRVLREDVFWEEEQKRNLCRKCGQAGHFASDCNNDASSSALSNSDPHKTKPFIFLNISILREYLECEMRPDSHSNFPFDPERAMDDWVFLCFFVGNDFLPHMPSLELRDGAIDTLLDIYKGNAERLGGHLTSDGRINLQRAWVIVSELGKVENDMMRRRKEREDRREENFRKRRKVETDAPAVLQQAVASSPSVSSVSSSGRTAGDEAVEDLRLHEPGGRARYYTSKFGEDSAELIRRVAADYLCGLSWVMAYYYQGCPSWSWFYPHHYAPFALDLVEYINHDAREWTAQPEFDLGSPFRPFDQLMSVFPAASRHHLPEPFRKLMTDADSEIVMYYPEDFAIDLNGKKQSWQGVCLLPFIDERKLLKALESVYPELKEHEQKLNAQGHDVLFVVEPNRLFAFMCMLDGEDSIWPLDVLLSGGLAGSLRLYADAPQLDAPVAIDVDKEDDRRDIVQQDAAVNSNRSAAALYYPPGVSGQESTMKMHFSARLLPAARRPPTVLTTEDRQYVRAGIRMNAGPSSHGHSMNREWAERQDREPVFKAPRYNSNYR